MSANRIARVMKVEYGARGSEARAELVVIGSDSLEDLQGRVNRWLNKEGTQHMLTWKMQWAHGKVSPQFEVVVSDAD